ncbi:hypothetical protein C437_01595 [Haloarcula vallismortis ATCC 29715]|nr:hypothetical protein C437_01595 [Haloarcula vallismortis ATCC 29715]
MTVFLHESKEGKIGFNPSSESDPARHWIFTRENAGFRFYFLVHDRDEVLGYKIRPRSLQWIGRFIYGREINYLEEPCEEVAELVSEAVEVREEPLDIGLMEKHCPGCQRFHEVTVMPKMDLAIHGVPGQRVFEETCPDCGESFVVKKTLWNLPGEGYPENRCELDESRLWEYSRRTP